MLSQYMGFGVLTSEPYMKQCKNGELAFLRLAVKRDYTKNKYDILHFIAENHQSKYAKEYLRKGDYVAVRAVPFSSSLTIENAKRKYITTRFKVVSIYLISRKQDTLIDDSGCSIFPDMYEFSNFFKKGKI